MPALKVLIATDGSLASRDAIAEAARLLPLAAAEVHVVSVAITPPVTEAYDRMGPGVGALVAEAAKAAKADLKDALTQLTALGVSATAHERQGDAATEVLAAAAAIGADVVVVGAYGKGFLERLFAGSTSDAIVHGFPGAVLVAHPRAA